MAQLPVNRVTLDAVLSRERAKGARVASGEPVKRTVAKCKRAMPAAWTKVGAVRCGEKWLDLTQEAS